MKDGSDGRRRRKIEELADHRGPEGSAVDVWSEPVAVLACVHGARVDRVGKRADRAAGSVPLHRLSSRDATRRLEADL
jgi:hypothetical protein